MADRATVHAVVFRGSNDVVVFVPERTCLDAARDLARVVGLGVAIHLTADDGAAWRGVTGARWRSETCAAVLRSVHSTARGSVCGRPARNVDGQGRPVCGIHEPTALAERIARVRVEARAKVSARSHVQDGQRSLTSGERE